jgi:SpoIID/LytB domain protein
MSRVIALATLALLLCTSTALDSQTTAPDFRAIRVGFLAAGGGHHIETIPLETYVARVVAGEAARDSQPAALEALAIAVRTFALANRGRHRADAFDVCDQTHCQVVRAATEATERAAKATAGRVLLRDGAPASIYYTASCGGRTEVPSAVWPGAEDPAFLPSQEDDACEGAPAWSATLQDVDLVRALRAAGFRGRAIEDLRVGSRTSSGRVARLTVTGLQPSSISGQDFRVAIGRTIGWQHIKSTAFDVRRVDGGYRFDGHGSGHGVGLCVIGSARLAVRGRTADEILARYFPGLPISGSDRGRTGVGPGSDRGRTEVGPGSDLNRSVAKAPPGIVVSLPDEDEGARTAVERQVLRARDEMARALNVPAPSTVTLRFHPTVDAFQRATRLPWFAGSAASAGELHLVPIAGLRDRGTLDQTLRRGLVHLMIDAQLASRPAWVRDGAAIYFANPHDATLEGRVACPGDAELQQPVSIGALSNAYARARACVAKQIASGRGWRDVK